MSIAERSQIIQAGMKVLPVIGSQNDIEHHVGETTGKTRECTAGCEGFRIEVRWPSGHVTDVCSIMLVKDGIDLRITR